MQAVTTPLYQLWFNFGLLDQGWTNCLEVPNGLEELRKYVAPLCIPDQLAGAFRTYDSFTANFATHGFDGDSMNDGG